MKRVALCLIVAGVATLWLTQNGTWTPTQLSGRWKPNAPQLPEDPEAQRNEDRRVAKIWAKMLLPPTGPPPKSKAHCPHPRFIINHVCPGCTDEHEALLWTLGRRLEDVTWNDVVYGVHTFFVNRAGHCVQEEPGPLYSANARRGITRKVGEQCITLHSTETGHMFWRQTVCF